MAAAATPDEVERGASPPPSAARAGGPRPRPSARAEILVARGGVAARAAARARRAEVREAAKPWPEADADVCEAIDFLEYYARGALELDAAAPPLLQVPGERNELR